MPLVQFRRDPGDGEPGAESLRVPATCACIARARARATVICCSFARAQSTYHALESLDNTTASWLGRFEHAADVTRDVYEGRAPAPTVIDMALDRELSAAEAQPLPLEPVSCDVAGVALESLLTDDESMVVLPDMRST